VTFSDIRSWLIFPDGFSGHGWNRFCKANQQSGEDKLAKRDFARE
jgi:hypothetical protein